MSWCDVKPQQRIKNEGLWLATVDWASALPLEHARGNKTVLTDGTQYMYS